ncbi:hypothetical protein [Rhizobium leguminosarum]|uniref:hypothetical protein n=1 Tax=Rhizobium leguminosarum TaxID=384 RepID=UPI001C963341|nr:hypothetical protein [Rhizobium leguminosarum]MBY5740447.1 hypothetical protein [Rhizobium leguminosarum]
MGWKTPKIEYVNGYKIVEVEGPTFKVYDGDRQLGDDFPTPAKPLLTQPRCQNGIIRAARAIPGKVGSGFPSGIA